MATITQLEIPFSGVIKRAWPKMPERIEGIIRVGCKYLYKPDDAYDLLLGADLFEQPHRGDPWKKVFIAFVPNYQPEPQLDEMVRQWVRAQVGDFSVLVTYQKGREIQISIPGDIFNDNETLVRRGSDSRRRRSAVLSAQRN